MSSGADGSVTLNPSFVPSCGRQNELGRNANGDFAVFRSLLKNLLKISSEVRADERDVERWRDALEKLPSEFTDSEGLLRDFKMRATDFSGLVFRLRLDRRGLFVQRGNAAFLYGDSEKASCGKP